jgi:predicted Zn-dependent peptidase
MGKVEKTILENGIRIVTEQMPQVRSVSMGIWVNAGTRDEIPAENGVSHFIEHMIFKGTKRRSALQIAKEFDAIGGISNAFTSKEITCFHAKVMDTHLDTMVDLLSDIFIDSVFDPVEIERERQVILQEIGMAEDTPDDHVHTLLHKIFWSDNHPLGWSVLGTADTVCAIESTTIEKYFKNTYLPDRIVVVAAGHINHAQFVNVLRTLFESIPKRDGFSDRVCPSIYSSVATYPKELEQVHICLSTKGLRVTEPRRYPICLLNVILGGSMSSRLFQEVRERRGLAYSIFSFQSSYVDTGMLGVYVGTHEKSINETVSVILKEIKRMKEKPVGEDELRAAKEHVKGGLYLASESTDNRMHRLAQNEIYFGRYVPLEEVIEGLEKVSSSDIQELANELFQEKYCSAVLLGPVEGKDTINQGGLKL